MKHRIKKKTKRKALNKALARLPKILQEIKIRLTKKDFDK